LHLWHGLAEAVRKEEWVYLAKGVSGGSSSRFQRPGTSC
jgi:hypothetical protein